MGEPVSSGISPEVRPETSAAKPSGPRRQLIMAAWISAASAAALVFAELLALDYAVVWAVGSAHTFPQSVLQGLAVLGGLAALWITYRLFRSALSNELKLVAPPAPPN